MKKMRKMLAAILAAGMIVNVMPVEVFAAGTLEDPKVTVTVDDSTDQNGHITTTTTTTEEAAGTNAEGAEVSHTETTINTTVTDEAGAVLKESGSVAGNETTKKEKTEDISDVTVTLTPGTQQQGISGTASQKTEGVTEEQNPNNYDVTTTTETDRKVNANLSEAELSTGNGEDVDIDTALTPIQPVWSTDKQDVYAPDSNSDTVTPDTPKPDGYDFLYTGSGEWSRYSIIYTDLDENGEIEKGTTSASQFQLTDMSDPDAQNKTVHTTYCVELGRTAKDRYWYTIDNLESKTYYKTEDAENHVRAIVNNGYWGTAEGTGSLAQIKADLKAAGETKTGLTDEQIDAMTEGEALTATQIAIWQYANIMHGVELPEYSDSEAKARIAAFAKYLEGLTEAPDETEVITEDKFIKEMSLTVGEKVAQKHGDNEGTGQNNATDETYHVDLTFSLVVQPSDTNDDLIIKVVSGGEVIHTARLAGSSKEGETFGKIAPDSDGNYTLTGLQLVEGQDIDFNLKLEGAQYLKQGVYIFTSQERAVEDSEGNITTKSSQTQVGIAEGTRKVDVNMSVTLRFDVEEATITTEHKWGNRWEKDYQAESPDETPKDASSNDGDSTTNSDLTAKEVPILTAAKREVPKTGDRSGLWLALSMLSGTTLIGWHVLDCRRRKIRIESEEVG